MVATKVGLTLRSRGGKARRPLLYVGHVSYFKFKGAHMKKLLVKTLLTSFVLSISPLAAAEQKLDIVQIMGQFVQASYAASRCIKPDQETLSRFLYNYKVVSIRAGEELKKRNPGQSDQQIVDSLKQRTGAVEKAIDEVIRTNSCSDPRIQDLLKRFEVQANLKF
jgi:hypothetical protein